MIGIYSSEELNDGGVVYSYDMLWGRTFAPMYETLVLNRVKGKTYAEKKEFVRELAVKWSYMRGNVTMSWYDCAEIGNWFEKYGRRYGLLEEFRENWIC